MKFVNKQETPEQLIKDSRAQAGSTLIYKDKIYYKRNKSSVDYLAPLEMLYDIDYVLDSLSNTIVLFRALCGHPKLSKFKGDYKDILVKIHEEKIKFNNLKSKYFVHYAPSEMDFGKEKKKLLDFFELSLEEKEKRHRFSSSIGYDLFDSNYYKSKGLPWEVTDGRNREVVEKIEKEFFSIGSTLTDTIYNNSVKKYSSRYEDNYDEKVYHYRQSIIEVVPARYNDNRFHIKVKYLRYLEDIIPDTEIKTLNLDTKTGDLFFSVYGKAKFDFSMNLYKESYNGEYSEHGLSMSLLKRAVISHYENNNTRGVITERIFGYFNEDELTQEKIVKFILVMDRIDNSPYKELFENVAKYIRVPDKNKWKLQDLLGVSKQQLELLNTYNKYEQNNFMLMVDILKRNHTRLYTEENINKLNSTTFLMINHQYTVENILSNIASKFVLSFSDIKKITEYVDVDAHERQCIGNVDYMYRDYIDAYRRLVNAGYRTEESINFTPYSLALEHNIVTHEYRVLKDDINSKELEAKYDSTFDVITKKKYKYNGENIVFLPADSTEKLKEEGRSLSHCVGSYTSNILEDRCVIFLARKEKEIDESWFTVEIRKTVNGLVLGQQQSINRHRLPEELREQLEKDIRKINSIDKDVA